ncbi:MAG: magnesium-translocating P-type ATPase [Niastella sp.]|nr:magnesium-translocating P-type ATPase [Niastella sp.]
MLILIIACGDELQGCRQKWAIASGMQSNGLPPTTTLSGTEGFWSYTAAALYQRLNTSAAGLDGAEAKRRLAALHQQERVRKPWQRNLLLLLSQYRNPLVLLLVLAVVLSVSLGEYSNSVIILTVLVLTGVLGFVQERNAGRAMEQLQLLVKTRSTVQRSGKKEEVLIEEVAPGDIVLVNAGDIIPADAFIVSSNDLHVNESVLTGESFPSEKFAGVCAFDTPLNSVTNAVFKGTSVVNGSATLLAVHTGRQSELGQLSGMLQQQGPVNAFEKGIRQFGFLLMRLTVIITLAVLVLNILLHKPMVDSLLFALALAVGLAPELLPAIVTITLSAGARRMAAKKVIVKKLSAIQSLGEMDVLCCDKTGTLTKGEMHLSSVTDVDGNHSEKVLLYAYLNALFETGFTNPLDAAILRYPQPDVAGCSKQDEVPYDFIRKRLSIVANIRGRGAIMITKGAVDNVLGCCTQVELPDGRTVAMQQVKPQLDQLFGGYCAQGLRTIGVCYKDVGDDPVINKDDEVDMVFLGFLTFTDPLKEGIESSLGQLTASGIRVKLITGDHRLVARQTATHIGMNTASILTGDVIDRMDTTGLQRQVNEVDVFAEIVPVQKERIIRALQRNGHAVGFLGDGINDAAALKAADAGISIDNAVDVARDAASLVLLEKDFDVIRAGVMEGRKTFSNTLKYIFVTTSANFGNMFSMAIASLVLPFLPLLPIQILLNNFLSDLPALAIASDRVDDELLQRPRRWDIQYIRRFMVVFGLQSSLFDLLTFGLLLYVFHATPEGFRTGWFVESLLTQLLILQVIRTQRPFFKSRPSAYLGLASVIILLVALMLPYLPFAGIFSLRPLPLLWMACILALSLLYILMAEVSKRYLMRKL